MIILCGLVIGDHDEYIRLRVTQQCYFVDSYKDLHRKCCDVKVSELLKEEL